MSAVSLKFFMPVKVASTEKKGPREEMDKVCEQISQALQQKKVKAAGAAMALLEDPCKDMDLEKAHFEVCLPISGKIKGEGDLKSKELPKGAFACLTHSGPIEKIPEAYRAVLQWVEENGYRIAGPAREVHHKGMGGRQGSQVEYIVEIQFPVRK